MLIFSDTSKPQTKGRLKKASDNKCSLFSKELIKTAILEGEQHFTSSEFLDVKLLTLRLCSVVNKVSFYRLPDFTDVKLLTISKQIHKKSHTH
jgi:hypothetical protein